MSPQGVWLVGFAGTGGAENQGRGATIQTASQQIIQLFDTAGNRLAPNFSIMLRGDQARKYAQPTGLDGVIVIALAKFDPSEFEHAQASAGSAVVWRELLHLNNAVAQTQHMRISADQPPVHFVVQ